MTFDANAIHATPFVLLFICIQPLQSCLLNILSKLSVCGNPRVSCLLCSHSIVFINCYRIILFNCQYLCSLRWRRVVSRRYFSRICSSFFYWKHNAFSFHSPAFAANFCRATVDASYLYAIAHSSSSCTKSFPAFHTVRHTDDDNDVTNRDIFRSSHSVMTHIRSAVHLIAASYKAVSAVIRTLRCWRSAGEMMRMRKMRRQVMHRTEPFSTRHIRFRVRKHPVV